jgi:ABC-2 type transport system ATP-binding protein
MLGRMKEPVLVCSELRKAYGELQAVDGVSFTVAEGETYGLLGPNGAGKTTAISMVVGILARDAGEVRIDGEPLTPSRVRVKSRIGYVPQELALYPDLTGRENLRFFARLYGLSGRQASGRADEVLDIVGLADRAGDLVKEYSGGMKRRLNIGAGLLHRPRLLVLDEPTAGVDPQSRNAILESVERLAGEGIAVLYTTHYMEEAERLCDRVGIIDLGKLRAEGTRRELVSLVGERDRISLEATGDVPAAVAAAAKLPGVQPAEAGDARIELLVEDASTALPAILTAVTANGAAVRSVSIAEPNLEAVFLHLTGKALRD